jgi:hypothetical protein
LAAICIHLVTVDAGLLLGAGALRDRVGHGRRFLVGLVVFAIDSPLRLGAQRAVHTVSNRRPLLGEAKLFDVRRAS